MIVVWYSEGESLTPTKGPDCCTKGGKGPLRSLKLVIQGLTYQTIMFHLQRTVSCAWHVKITKQNFSSRTELSYNTK